MSCSKNDFTACTGSKALSHCISLSMFTVVLLKTACSFHFLIKGILATEICELLTTCWSGSEDEASNLVLRGEEITLLCGW